MAHTPQEEMQQLILTCLDKQDFQTALTCLDIYKKNFCRDSFYESANVSLLAIGGPKVTVIGLDIPDSAIEDYFAKEEYCNLEFVSFAGYDYIRDLTNYLPSCDSKYFCFLENNQQYEVSRIASLVYCLEEYPTLDAVVCARNHIDSNGNILAHPDYAYEETLGNKILTGKILLEYSIGANVNLYGTPSTLMVSTNYAKALTFTDANVTPDLCSMALMYQLLLPSRIRYVYTPFVSTQLEKYHDTSAIYEAYKDYIRHLTTSGLLSCDVPETQRFADLPAQKTILPRDITFITNVSGGGYYNVLPVVEEAKRRGYQVHVTNDRHVKAEIGVYSQHICYPENSKFSLIMLHDMTQGSLSWPNFWEVERWNKFDVGILPGKSWAERWTQCNCFYYAHPRSGVYPLGYPKSDQICSDQFHERTEELRRKLDLKYDFTILYAPSWENDNKEDDFVRALSSLNVNLIIKHNCWQSHPPIQRNIEEMRALHENKYENVHYIEQEESIMTAIALCDLIVSDESNVMTDAILLNKPSIAVTDWLIPDETPHRPACVPIDYVIKCKKSELRQTVEAIISQEISCEEYVKKGWDTFNNVGNSCREIMDVIEYFTQETPIMTSPDVLSKQLSQAKYSPCTMWN